MAKQNAIFHAFNGGELSPFLDGRTDQEKYYVGAKTLENFIPTVPGPAVRRGGTRFVAAVKDNTKRVWTLRFEFNQDQAYILEFGDQYIRFFVSRAQLLSGLSAYEIASPYLLADLTTDDGTCALIVAQSADVLYITHSGGDYAPRTLSRLGATNWVLTEFEPEAGPFKDLDPDAAIEVYASAATGEDITLTASSAIFVAGNVGRLFYMEAENLAAAKPWKTGESVSADAIRRHAGNYYRATAAGTTGTGPPLHERGVGSDNGVSWEYLHSGYGIVEISAVAGDGLSATADVVLRLPGEVVRSGEDTTGVGIPDWATTTAYTGETSLGAGDGDKVRINAINEFPGLLAGRGGGKVYHCLLDHTSGDFDEDLSNGNWEFLFDIDETTNAFNFTKYWAHAAWSSVEGWPTAVGFYRERLAFAKGRTIYTSQSGDFDNFNRKVGPDVTPDAALVLPISSDRVDQIRWLTPLKRALAVGTAGGELTIAEATDSQVFSAENATAIPHTDYGSRRQPAQRIGNVALFLQRAGRKLREYRYSFEEDQFVAPDLTVLAEHVTESGIVDICYQQEPDSVVWCARADGALIGLTYNRERGVVGWHRHPIGGNGFVECVETIPSPDGSRDDLWLVVKRTINGATKRYHEYMEAPLADGDELEDAFYVDSGLTYDGASATVLSGLDHLEGESVDILGDGAVLPSKTVASGAITLSSAVTKAQVGKGFTSKLQTMRIEAGGAAGTAQGKLKRIARMVVRFLNTLGGKQGPAFDSLSEILYRSSADDMDDAPPLFSGDKVLPFEGGWDRNGYVCIQQDQPLPMTVVAIMPDVTTNDG